LSSSLLVLRSLRLLWALTSRSHHTHALHRPPESAVGRILAPATHRPAVLPYCDESGRDGTAQSSSSGSRRLLLDRGLATPREFEVRGSRFEVRAQIRSVEQRSGSENRVYGYGVSGGRVGVRKGVILWMFCWECFRLFWTLALRRGSGRQLLRCVGVGVGCVCGGCVWCGCCGLCVV
jgi:hypothetical protein